MDCDMCGKAGAKNRKVTRSFGSGRAAFLIEGVPLVRCAHRGESYFTADTLKEIDRIRRDWRKLSVDKRVAVAKFRGAA